MMSLPPPKPKKPQHLWIAVALTAATPGAVCGASTDATGAGWPQSVFAVPVAFGLVAIVLVLIGAMKPARRLVWHFGATLIVGSLPLFGAGSIVSGLQYAAMAVR